MQDILNELLAMNKRIKSGEVLSDDDSRRFCELYDAAVEFASSIENDQASTCIRERYINAKKWGTIADELGQTTDDAVRKCATRAIMKYS